ncbi:uncharacterized protein LOC129761203 [Toxorhynchites rutilus septentrionalis]|uniref:uncharacterized protein LOC129761203 n=1 Tax=Toxorhynchites rutilus septentrionalis TaxID=329112 RepID=UPI00247AF9A0|nr:uncharacterized protein LOC129761203 [Toxorhynchites rutilus septentrionalis]
MEKKSCAKCSQTINGIDFITCRGYCGRMFHMACAAGQTGVTRALMNYFTTHKRNLFWMCDDCADLFQNPHLRSITKVADEKSPLVSLTEAINNLQTEIKHLSSKPAPNLSSAVKRWPTIEPIRAAKRLRGPDLDYKVPECKSGSKQVGQNVTSVPVIEKPTTKFWIYLSRIRPDVSIQDVQKMVRANLELSHDPEVVKLVAKGVDTSNMTYISFKVGLDPTLRTTALDPSTWPEGIMFREFEEHTIQNFRKPSVIHLTPTSVVPPDVLIQP